MEAEGQHPGAEGKPSKHKKRKKHPPEASHSISAVTVEEDRKPKEKQIPKSEPEPRTKKPKKPKKTSINRETSDFREEGEEYQQLDQKSPSETKPKKLIKPPQSDETSKPGDEEEIGNETSSKPEEPEKPPPPLKVRIQVLPEHPDKTAPLVGYFPSGFDLVKKQHQDHENGSEFGKVQVYRNKNRPNRMELVVKPNDEKVDFVGTSYSGEAATGQVCTYALGVLDKEAGTLKIVPIAANKIFRLEPRVRGSGPSIKETSGMPVGKLTAEQKADRIRELTQLYGTKKSITQAKKLDSLNQKEDPEAKEDLDRKVKEVKINKGALESTNAPTARNIPPYDLSATTPEQAYPIDKIILKGEWDYLLDILELLRVGEEITADSYPTFVCNRIHKLWDIQDEMEKTTLACIYSFITHLVKFKDQHSMDGFSSAKQHKIPSILRNRFSAMFADPQLKRLSDEKNALIVSYVLVLTLIADRHRTDLVDIAKDLRMSPLTLRVHYEHLGCKLLRENSNLLATLPLPLQFPKLRRKRQR